MEPITSSILAAAENGDNCAAQALFSTLYAELHRVAKYQLARQGAEGAISPTTVLHETYLEMASRTGPSFPDRGRFMAYAARVMRGLIIDQVRRRFAQKRGGQFQITSLESHEPQDAAETAELSRIGDALDDLARLDPTLAEVVDMKFFCGLSFAEIAGLRGVSERTVQRRWDKARVYLYHTIRSDL